MLFQKSCTMVEIPVAVWAVKRVAMMRGACTIVKLNTYFDSLFFAGPAQSKLSARLHKLRPVVPATIAIRLHCSRGSISRWVALSTFVSPLPIGLSNRAPTENQAIPLWQHPECWHQCRIWSHGVSHKGWSALIQRILLSHHPFDVTLPIVPILQLLSQSGGLYRLGRCSLRQRQAVGGCGIAPMPAKQITNKSDSQVCTAIQHNWRMATNKLTRQRCPSPVRAELKHDRGKLAGAHKDSSTTCGKLAQSLCGGDSELFAVSWDRQINWLSPCNSSHPCLSDPRRQRWGCYLGGGCGGGAGAVWMWMWCGDVWDPYSLAPLLNLQPRNIPTPLFYPLFPSSPIPIPPTLPLSPLLPSSPIHRGTSET